MSDQCYYTQELPSCIHGKVDYCHKCERALMDKVMELSGRIEALHEFKLKQIDENRKISRRIDEIEKLAEFNISPEVKQIMDSGFKECKERIEHLERLYQSSTEVESSLLTRIKKLESINITNCKYKKPHKCPVCEGKCKKMLELPAGGYYEISCKSCEGKGIIWE